MSVAGLYSITKDGGVTYTLLTKPASQLFEKIHNTKNRQIILLNRELEAEWLNPDLAEDHIRDIFQFQYDDSSLETYPVTKEINSTKYHLDNDEVIRPVEYSELQPFLKELEGVR